LQVSLRYFLSILFGLSETTSGLGFLYEELLEFILHQLVLDIPWETIVQMRKV